MILFFVAPGTITGKALSSNATSGGGSGYGYGQVTTVIQGVGGTVTSDPYGISCTTGECSQSFANGTSVTLTASAQTGYTFEKWDGDCTGTTTTCSVTMDTG